MEKISVGLVLIISVFAVSSAAAAPVMTPIDLIKKGHEEEKLERYDKAVEYYTSAIAAKKVNEAALLDIYFNRGNCYFKKGEFDKAVDDYRKVVKANPQYAEAFVNLANA